jgi:beta-glucanase (GH16 family)
MENKPIDVKKVFVIIVFIVFIVSCKKNNTILTVIPPVVHTPPLTYTLAWSDEFNGSSVDTTKWVIENRNAGVNQEKEYYLPSNVSVANGNLIFTAKNESFGGQPYTSGKMTTYGKFAPLYGRIEASIKVPLGTGMWPAFWMIGSDYSTVNWPACGEIDIMEHLNSTNIIYGTMHWNENGATSYGGTTTADNTGYHVYAVEWDANTIKWYVDNNLYLTANINENTNGIGAFHLPFYIILNLAVGGTFPGPNVDESQMPESMYVDYVRVYTAN